MARTKKQPGPPPPVVNGPATGEVLTLAEAAAYLRLSEDAVVAAATTQRLPGRLVRGEWRFMKDAVQRWLSESQPTGEMRKAAQLAMAGSWKDDPDIEQIVEDAMRRRGREPDSQGKYAGHRPAEKGDE